MAFAAFAGAVFLAFSSAWAASDTPAAKTLAAIQAAAEDSRDEKAAIAAYEKFLADFPKADERFEAAFHLSEAYQPAGRAADSVALCDRMLTDGPPQEVREKLLVSRAEAFQWTGDKAKTLSELEAALPSLKDPKRSLAVRIEIADFAGQIGRHDLARDRYDALSKEALDARSQMQVLYGREAAYGKLKQTAKLAEALEAESKTAQGDWAMRLAIKAAELRAASGDGEAGRKRLDELDKAGVPASLASILFLARAEAHASTGQGAAFDREVESRLAAKSSPALESAYRLHLGQAFLDAGEVAKAREVVKPLAGSDDRYVQRAVASLLSDADAIGKPPVAFRVQDTAGREFSAGAYAGKVVLIDFWASWCAPCIAEMPNVKATYEALRGKGFEILGVSLDNDLSAFRKYVADNALPWPQAADGKGWKNEVAATFGVRAIPHTVLLDRKGIVRAIGVRGDRLRPAIEKLL